MHKLSRFFCLILGLYTLISLFGCTSQTQQVQKLTPEEKAFKEDLSSLEKVEITAPLVSLSTYKWKVKPNQVLGVIDKINDPEDIKAFTDEIDKSFDSPLNVVAGISESLRIRFYTSRNKYVYTFKYIRYRHYLYGYKRQKWPGKGKESDLDIKDDIPSVMGNKVSKRFDELIISKLPEKIRKHFK